MKAAECRTASAVAKKMEGARGIEPPPRLLDKADGFEDRGVPSTIAPLTCAHPEKAIPIVALADFVVGRKF